MVYASTPVNRARRRGYLRNVAVALGNQHDPELFPLLESCFSAEESPLVRGHLAWALGQTPHPLAKLVLTRNHPVEKDPFVLDEIDRAIRLVKN